ncbi:ImmA/IrrE family metallo-endopeptidase [Clostridium beijerinckii]|uniref:ImmA/IrrE family metallo-endopeptidase n=1 Tax=Clostridium beijerinckii TaxID=1520 RepID=UPI00098C9AB7|nr:ImmA/IrrE family metallo-endopeptidase [Clostridium beijerinckii]MBA8935568.1 Zn-dependent peptidase ImmA (M78 family) [Clostridium beijerinckii]NRU39963.1 Zn-dependent peptidase ImmA (M78 family) [Clostridium beijerinckii]NSA96758.1 Zn-dependent peptidase ImmA (M78 family) [Clostridium beijerinckii]OOM61310.1 metallopeptidase ImmA [Clostridium beijerinckii]OOM71802.1 metallopeptidase ImmA [Clostridium beijerinckii]
MYAWIDNIILGIKDNDNYTNVYELYDYLEIEIVKLMPTNILLRGNDSFYYRDLNDKEIVFIRNDLNDTMEKFILLHELAHALLHTHIYEAAFNKNFINKDKIEKQANYFAFKMLNINLDKIELEGMTIEQISTYIGIPYNLLSNLLT